MRVSGRPRRSQRAIIEEPLKALLNFSELILNSFAVGDVFDGACRKLSARLAGSSGA
jgi:hypothetical protein